MCTKIYVHITYYMAENCVLTIFTKLKFTEMSFILFSEIEVYFVFEKSRIALFEPVCYYMLFIETVPDKTHSNNPFDKFIKLGRSFPPFHKQLNISELLNGKFRCTCTQFCLKK